LAGRLGFGRSGWRSAAGFGGWSARARRRPVKPSIGIGCSHLAPASSLSTQPRLQFRLPLPRNGQPTVPFSLGTTAAPNERKHTALFFVSAMIISTYSITARLARPRRATTWVAKQVGRGASASLQSCRCIEAVQIAYISSDTLTCTLLMSADPGGTSS